MSEISLALMRPKNLQIIGQELAIKWDDDSEDYIPFEKLRRACPCAGCKGETDILGNVYKGPERPYSPASFQLTSLKPVGGYAFAAVWADGHDSGIFSFEYLRRLAVHK